MNRLLVCAALLTSMSADTTSRAAKAAEAPKLVVVVVIDQLRRSEIDRLGPHFTGGLRRALNEGARLDGHYGHQNTYTGPGHALILSGSYGYLNGIFQNKWFNRATGRSESMLFDAKAQVINRGPVDPGEDSSPRNFYGSTVGDELRMSNGGKSRVVAVAIKERGALLLGGRTGTAYFFNELNGEWTSLNVLHERAAVLAGRIQCEAPARSVVRQGVDPLPARGGLRSRARRRSLGGRCAGSRQDLSAQDHRRGAEADGQVLGGLHVLGFRHRSYLRACAPRSRAKGSARTRSPTSWRSRSARPIFQATRLARTRTRSETRSSAPIARSASSSLISTSGWASAVGSP